MALEVGVLRELLRNYQAFTALHETDGVDSVTGPDGDTWSIWDLRYLAEEIPRRLPRKQAQAIMLCLIHNIKESDAAEMMGVSRTNPVGMYASSGLVNLIGMIERGELPRFRGDLSWAS